VELEIVPEPGDPERLAIEAALTELEPSPPGYRSRWRLAALAEGVEPLDGEDDPLAGRGSLPNQ
jgi:hypothetical protein